MAEEKVQTAQRYYTEQKELVQKKSAPYVEKSRQLYDAHMKPSVNLAVEKTRPHYEQYVAPHVDKVTQVLTEWLAQVQKVRHDMFAALVKEFASGCPRAISLVTASAKESVEHSCRQPEESVRNFLKFLALILCIVFRRLILKLIWKSFLLIIRILWFFSPLRLLIHFCRRTPSVQQPTQVSKKKRAKIDAAQ